MSTKPTPSPEWKEITPEVNSNAEFIEIANDFGNPLELLREAISNSVDARATEIAISFAVQDVDGSDTLVIRIEDNGQGMPEQVIAKDFWGLGFSTSRGDSSKIGEKGHGTKIYLRSEAVYVRTQHESGAFEARCERPMRNLRRGEPHRPSYRAIPKFREMSGTVIEIHGYNKNERSSFTQDVVRDYIQWFTKFGSVESLFGQQELADANAVIDGRSNDAAAIAARLNPPP